MSFDPFYRAKLEASQFVPREGQDEYLHPDYLGGRSPEAQVPDDFVTDAPPPGSRALAVKLIIMALVMIALLIGALAIFA